MTWQRLTASPSAVPSIGRARFDEHTTPGGRTRMMKMSLKCPLVHLGNYVLEYQEKVEYAGVLLNDNLNDNDDIMNQVCMFMLTQS